MGRGERNPRKRSTNHIGPGLRSAGANPGAAAFDGEDDSTMSPQRYRNMGKTTVEIIIPTPDASPAQAGEEERGLVVEAMSLLKRVTGTLLGSLAVSAQISNVLVCLFVILLGPAFVLGLLAR